MSHYPNPPQPPHQPWGPPPPPPVRPPNPKAGVWIAVAAGALLLMIGVFTVTAFAAPGFLVDDDEGGDSSSESEPASNEEDDQGGLPDIEIPPPNASGPESGEIPPPSVPDEPDESGEPDAPDAPEAAGDPEGFGGEYLALVAAGDEVGVDESMCADEQEWQYDTAVSERRALSLTNPRPDDVAPGGILADLSGPEGTLEGRITVVPDDAGGWCVETFYVF